MKKFVIIAAIALAGAGIIAAQQKCRKPNCAANAHKKLAAKRES